MKKTVSLKENHLFRRAYNRGKSAADSRLALYVRRNGRRNSRLGLTVSTKVGHAVVRNRVRRRIRELYRIHEADLLPGYDIVIVARTRAIYGRYSELKRSFVQQMKKLGLAAPKGDEPR